MQSAVIVIDTQVGIARNCTDADATIARMELLVRRAREAGAPVIWVQDHDGLALGSDDWQLAPPLVVAHGDKRIDKTHWDAFADTDLAEHLDAAGITRLLVAGAHTDYCIRTTALRAASDGYDVTIVSDAHMTGDTDVAGETLSAAAIVAHTNLYFAGLRYPGQSVDTATADEVAF